MRDQKFLPLKISASLVFFLQGFLYPAAIAESYGVINNAGKFVVKPQYSHISYEGNGVYVGLKRDGTKVAFDRIGRRLSEKYSKDKEFRAGDPPQSKSGDKFKSQYEKVIRIGQSMYAAKLADHFVAIDDNGKRLFDFPDRVTGFREFYDDSRTDLIIGDWQGDKPPAEGLLLNNVVFNRSGQMVVPPKYFVGQAMYGLIEVIEPTIGPDRLSGLMDYKGKWVVPMELSYFQITEPNRLIKTVRSAHFDSEDWRKGNLWMRTANFAHFLSDYNLIGMAQSDVHKLLGPGHEDGTVERYFLVTGFCGNAWTGFDIEYENGRVKRWRISGPTPKASPNWITQNVIFDRLSPYYRFKLILKE